MPLWSHWLVSGTLFFTRDHTVQEVEDSNPDSGTIVRRFWSKKATGKYFSAEYAIFCQF